MKHRLIFNHVQSARDSLRSTRLRTALTMLGVTIGVASITTILALSSGATQLIAGQIDALGGNIAIIQPGQHKTPLDNLGGGDRADRYAASTLTEKDVETMRHIKNVTAVAPLMIVSGTPKSASSDAATTQIIATTPDLKSALHLSLRIGDFPDNSTNTLTAAIGPQLSVDLFGTEESIGRIFTVHGSNYRVVGVLSSSAAPINFTNINFDRAMIVGFDNGKAINQGRAQIQQIIFSADSVTHLDQVARDAQTAILKNHDNENDFSILSGEQIASPSSQLFYIIAAFTTAVAGISLIVGGIGIMNIMLVSVSERTREIGIRKALGASSADIIWQFLIEALAMSIGGGILGYITGYALAFAIGAGLTFQPAFTWEIAATALGISLLTGTFFGLYPAIRAARKDPIESLRQYS